MHAPKVIQVIECYTNRGDGSADNPHRTLRQYYTLDGVFLAEELDEYIQILGGARRTTTENNNHE